MSVTFLGFLTSGPRLSLCRTPDVCFPEPSVTPTAIHQSADSYTPWENIQLHHICMMEGTSSICQPAHTLSLAYVTPLISPDMIGY